MLSFDVTHSNSSLVEHFIDVTHVVTSAEPSPMNQLNKGKLHAVTICRGATRLFPFLFLWLVLASNPRPRS